MAGLVQLFSAAFLVMAVLFAPLRMALGWIDADRAGLSARAAEGTVWRGMLRGATLGDLSLGDARLGLDLPGLVTLRPGLRIAANGEVRGGGTLRATGLASVDAALSLGAVAPGSPFEGRLVLSGFQAQFRKDSCAVAGGEVALQDIRLSGAPIAGLRLSGRAGCRGRVLIVPLRGQAGGVAIEADLAVDRAGRYRLESRLRVTDPLIAAAAGAAGFERGLDGFSRIDEGRIGVLEPRPAERAVEPG